MTKQISKSDNKSLLLKSVIHVAAWLFFYSLPFLAGMPFDNPRLLIKAGLHTLILVIFFYVNSNFLVPQILKKGKTGFYILTLLFGIAIIFFYYQLVDVIMQVDPVPLEKIAREGSSKMRGARKIYGPIFSAIFIFALSTSIHITNDWFKNEKQRKEMENEKLISELAFLKSQVSPHFLFNTLNNIYSLSLSNSEHTADAILKLSHLLRYMLYESQDKLVSLEKEISYLQNYIDLQKMRLTQNVKVSFQVNGSLSGRLIEPMLLIPFVENAFKHGVNYSQNSFVDILIDVSDKKLFMKVENSIHPKSKEQNKNSGIGLVNIYKRLELLYPGNHSLQTSQQENKYVVELNMKLN
jgi:two-component system LytT family sensor kinase